MVKMLIARQIAPKRVITTEGEELGRILDILIDETTGKLDTLILEANIDNANARKMKKADGYIYIPYKAVMAVGDHVIVDAKDL